MTDEAPKNPNFMQQSDSQNKRRPLWFAYHTAMILLFAYSAVIATLHYFYPISVGHLLDVTQSISGQLSSFMFVFDAVARRLTKEGLSSRIPLIHHILVVNWLLTLFACAVITRNIGQLRHKSWPSLTKSLGFGRYVPGDSALPLGLICMAAGIAVAFFGFGFSFGHLPAMIHYDAMLPFLGMFFASIPMGWKVAWAALATGNWIAPDPQSRPPPE